MAVNLIRYQPFTELMSLRQAMDRLFEDSFVRPWHLWADGAKGEVLLDMYQTKDDVTVKATLPGVKPEEVDNSITGDTLTIKGEHKEEQEVRDEDYFRKEHRYGAFSRSVALPGGLKTEKAEASFDNGILTVTIPKSEEIKPKQIKVETKRATEDKK